MRTIDRNIRDLRQTMQEKTLTEPYNPSAIDLLPYKQLFMHIAARETAGSFVVDETNREVISGLFNYFMKVPGPLDCRKGLWLEGPVGTGKSTLMQVFSAYMRHLNRGFKVFICGHITSAFALDGQLDLFLENTKGFVPGPVDICFDELGREPVPAAHYGTKMNVMQHILHVRYSYWQSRGVRTFVTTNTTAGDIGRLYGDYIRDRRKEMFNILVLRGDSRRG